LRHETVAGNQESILVNIVAVDAEIIRNSGMLPFGQPGAAAATYVGH
jgi:hypothetical protein